MLQRFRPCCGRAGDFTSKVQAVLFGAGDFMLQTFRPCCLEQVISCFKRSGRAVAEQVVSCFKRSGRAVADQVVSCFKGGHFIPHKVACLQFLASTP
jgi:hypothetical protein